MGLEPKLTGWVLFGSQIGWQNYPHGHSQTRTDASAYPFFYAAPAQVAGHTRASQPVPKLFLVRLAQNPRRKFRTYFAASWANTWVKAFALICSGPD